MESDSRPWGSTSKTSRHKPVRLAPESEESKKTNRTFFIVFVASCGGLVLLLLVLGEAADLQGRLMLEVVSSSSRGSGAQLTILGQMVERQGLFLRQVRQEPQLQRRSPLCSPLPYPSFLR